MADPSLPTQPLRSSPLSESPENFGDILSQYQKSSSRKTEGSRQIQATVIAVNAESIFFDIGYKSEGILPLAALQGETAQTRRQSAGHR